MLLSRAERQRMIFEELGKRDIRSTKIVSHVRSMSILLINFVFHTDYQLRMRWIPIYTVDEYEFVRKYIEIPEYAILDKQVTIPQHETSKILLENKELYDFVIMKLDEVMELKAMANLYTGDSI